jgi:hypothetical protein
MGKIRVFIVKEDGKFDFCDRERSAKAPRQAEEKEASLGPQPHALNGHEKEDWKHVEKSM